MGHRTPYFTLAPGTGGDTPSGIAWHSFVGSQKDVADGVANAYEAPVVFPYIRGGNGTRLIGVWVEMKAASGSLAATETIEVEFYKATGGDGSTESFLATGAKVTLDTSSVVNTAYSWTGSILYDEGDLGVIRTNRTNDSGFAEDLIITYILETDEGQVLFAPLSQGTTAGTNRDLQWFSQGSALAASLRGIMSGSVEGWTVWIRDGATDGTWDLDLRQSGNPWSNSGTTTYEIDLYEEMDLGIQTGCGAAHLWECSSMGKAISPRMDEEVASNTYFAVGAVFYPDVPGVSMFSNRIDTNFTDASTRYVRPFCGTSTSSSSTAYTKNFVHHGDNFAMFASAVGHSTAMVSGNTYNSAIRLNDTTDEIIHELDFASTTHQLRHQHDFVMGNIFDLADGDEYAFKMWSPGTNTTDLGVVYQCWVLIDKVFFESKVKDTAISDNTLKEKLVSYWRHDGSDLTDSHGSYDWAVYGANNLPGQVAGISGNATEFDASNTEAIVISGIPEAYNPDNGIFHASMFIKFNTELTTTQFIFGPNYSSGTGWSWGVYSTGGYIIFRIYTSEGSTSDVLTTRLKVGEWYFLEWGFEGGLAKPYVWINRKYRSWERTEGSMRGNSRPVTMGCRSSNTDYLDAVVQDVALWNHLPSHHDALKAMGGGTPLAYASWGTHAAPSDPYSIRDWPNPVSAVTEQVLVVDLSNEPAEWWAAWDTDDVEKIQAWDDSGNRLAVDVLRDTIDRTAKTGQLLVRYFGTKASTGTEKLHLYPPLDDYIAARPSEGFGQFAVYADLFHVFYPGHNLKDRTGCFNHLFLKASVSGALGPGPDYIAGQLGTAMDFDPVAGDYVRNGGDQSGFVGLRFRYPVMIATWMKIPATTDNAALIGISGTGEIIFGERNESGYKVMISGDSTFSTNSIEGTANGDTWHSYTGIQRAANDSELLKDGSTSEDTNTVDTQSSFDNGIHISLGSRGGGSQPGEGAIQWTRVYNHHLGQPSNAKIDEEHDNIVDNATFWGTPTWSGGAPAGLPADLLESNLIRSALLKGLAR